MVDQPEAGLAHSSIEQSNHWTQLADKHWRKNTKSKKVKPDVVKKEIWDVLEAESFPTPWLIQLEGSQLLEKYVHTKSWLAKTNMITQLLMAWIHR